MYKGMLLLGKSMLHISSSCTGISNMVIVSMILSRSWLYKWVLWNCKFEF